MKKITGLIIVFLLAGQAVSAGGEPPTTADKLNEVNLFNRVTDSIATMGKSDVQAAAIKKERQEQRRIKRLQKLQKKKQADVARRQKAVQNKNSHVHGLRKGSYVK